MPMITNSDGSTHYLNNYLSMPNRKIHHSGHITSGFRKTPDFTPQMMKSIKETRGKLHNMSERTKFRRGFSFA
jgi:hypothetical protein